jgi:trigger factor
VFTATYDLKPEVQLGEYKGIELEKLDEKPEEGAVDKQLDAMRERFARLEKSTEPAVLGDVCTIDFLGKVDDEPFEGGEGKDVPLELGSNSFVPGFEDQLVGVNVGDEVDVNITFPADYRVDELAGKDAVFHVAVKEIKHKFLSEMDDEFAKDVSEFETLQELRQDIEDKLNKEVQERIQNDLETKVVEKAMQQAAIELPDSMISYRQDMLIENLAGQMGRQGLDFSKYLEYTDTSVEKLRDDLKERAIRELKTESVLEAVAEAEKIEIADADLDGEYERLAGQTGRPQDEIKNIYEANKSMADSLRFSLRMNEAIKFLVNNSVIK